MTTKTTRSQKHSTKRQTVQVTGWVSRPVRDEIDRIAEHHGLTRSKAASTLLEEAVHQRLHVQHAVLLEPIIRQAIRKEIAGLKSGFLFFLVRIAFDTVLTKILIKNILRRWPGMTNEKYTAVVDESEKRARAHMTRRTPQLSELMEAVERSMNAAKEGRAAHA